MTPLVPPCEGAPAGTPRATTPYPRGPHATTPYATAPHPAAVHGPWFAVPAPDDTPALAGGAAPLRLICFPYAGGTASVYRDWGRHLGGRAEVLPVALPGRGPRLREAPYTDIRALTDALADALTAQRLTADYALFGHSMGALLAYEVACELRRRGEPGPRHLFVSASKAPHFHGDPAEDRVLSDEELRRSVRELGGLGEDPAVGSAYLERRLPVLRADLAVCSGYRWQPRAPLDCPMTAFSAADDPIAPAARVEAWREYTAGSFLRRHLTGGHFFLNGSSRQPVLDELRRELSRPHPTRRSPA
ncbi:thioesterase II family protein [Streptomyces sp. URMC 123]|uniref:thioesterase II family protein n=1 Tax=Streptomyces sp. URMC 123 TaxID=3423403 RepID=UPI003F1D0EC8